MQIATKTAKYHKNCGPGMLVNAAMRLIVAILLFHQRQPGEKTEK
jgi:hypothetical protein